ncbi:MAG: hypothetical protein LBC93_03595 [Synergistaceae bacterium]|nr:hypothetical protein [Synergistaceae bacterium]
MDIYADTACPRLPGQERSALRIFNRQECRYLSSEAQSMAYCLLGSQSVSQDVTENAIQQAVTLGALSGAVIDAQTFEALFHAAALDPSFRLPFAPPLFMTPFSPWVC